MAKDLAKGLGPPLPLGKVGPVFGTTGHRAVIRWSSTNAQKDKELFCKQWI